VTVVEGKTASIEGLSTLAIDTASTELCGGDTDSKNIKVEKVTTTDEDKDGICEGFDVGLALGCAVGLALGCTVEGALGFIVGFEVGVSVDIT